ncbi:BnaC09g13480D [Brassica napus]|uniref:BnaC09g13480D protein n=1 Tax=Brassica napus TaxID=3708 RepID=A0A078FYZ2_BRANA|nr:BnaC09g13480D [Brassica napus]
MGFIIRITNTVSLRWQWKKRNAVGTVKKIPFELKATYITIYILVECG